MGKRIALRARMTTRWIGATWLVCTIACAPGGAGGEKDAGAEASATAAEGGATACLKEVPVFMEFGSRVTVHAVNDDAADIWVMTTSTTACGGTGVGRASEGMVFEQPFVCGCECKSARAEPVASYARLAPGAATDFGWNGQELELREVCVEIGCPTNKHASAMVGFPRPSPPGAYTYAVFATRTLPEGCTILADGARAVCDRHLDDASASVPGRCPLAPTYEAHTAFELPVDGGPIALSLSLTPP